MSESVSGVAYDSLIVGREIIGKGSSRYVSFRISLPVAYQRTENGKLIDYFKTRYSFVEALRNALLAERPALDLPPLDTKRLIGGMSASVINARTKIINRFLRACQDNAVVLESDEWDQFLRGQKPGVPPPVANEAAAPPTPQELRESESQADRAPAPSLQENPAGIRGMSGWLASNFSIFADEARDANNAANANNIPTSPPPAASAPPQQFIEEDEMTQATSATADTNNSRRRSLDQILDPDDEDGLENVNSNAVAIMTPRQVMQAEFFEMIQQHIRGVGSVNDSNLQSGTPEELEAGESCMSIVGSAMGPLSYEFVGSFFLGLILNFIRDGSNVASSNTAIAFCVVWLALSTLVYSLGHVSGGHFNPAVTFAVFLRRHLTLAQTFFYWIFQFCGFVVSGIVSHELFNKITIPIEIREAVDSDDSVGNMSCYVLISGFTFFLCLTVLCTSTSVAQTGNSHFGIATGAIYAVAFNCLKYTGSSCNLGFDVAMTSVQWIYSSQFPLNFGSEYKFASDQQWGLLAGPFSGAFVSAVVYKYIKITAFSKRQTGCFNTFLKLTAPYWVEFFGTGLIAFVYCMLANDKDMLSFGYGCAVLSMSYFGGFISGGHFNPAISLAVYLQGGRLNFATLWFYIISQACGAFGGGFAFNWLYSFNPVPVPDWTLGDQHVSMVEFFFSFLVVFSYLNTAIAKDNRGNSFYGMSTGFASFASIALAEGMTGGLCNSALAFGLYLSKNGLTEMDLWGSRVIFVTVLVPLIAAVFAGVFFKVNMDGKKGIWAACCLQCRGNKKNDMDAGDPNAMEMIASRDVEEGDRPPAQRISEGSMPQSVQIAHQTSL